MLVMPELVYILERQDQLVVPMRALIPECMFYVLPGTLVPRYGALMHACVPVSLM